MKHILKINKHFIKRALKGGGMSINYTDSEAQGLHKSAETSQNIISGNATFISHSPHLQQVPHCKFKM